LATKILTETLARLDSPQKLFCSQCGVASIPRPEGATAATRYTCPPCCASLLKSRDFAAIDKLAAIAALIDARCLAESGLSTHLGTVAGVRS
jgi:hypothetical protein